MPRECGFLWARPDRQEKLVPAILSCNLDQSYPVNFEWTGTHDPSAWLSIPTAFAFIDRFAEEKIRHHNHTLVREGIRILAEAWDVKLETPDSMIGSMSIVPLPQDVAFPTTDKGREKFLGALWKSHKVICSCPVLANQLYVRVSAQIYNDADDYRKLAKAVNTMRKPQP